MASSDFAVIADVHGNEWALDAVLTDIRRRNVTRIVNLGDNANGPLNPAGTVERLRGLGAVHIRGNGDRMTGEGGETARRSAVFARERLSPDALRWLRELPRDRMGDDWFACHASPSNDTEYLLENVVDGRTVLAGRDDIASRLGRIEASLILCGHSHIPRMVRLADGRSIVNPGSVGLPAYTDDQLSPHVVENGSPAARYAIVARRGGDWRVEFIGLPYDWRTAAAAARAAGWPAWASNLETGYC